MTLTDLYYMYNICDLIQILLTVNYTEKELSVGPIILSLSFMLSLSSILTYIMYCML